MQYSLQDVFFSYVYKAEVEIPLTLSIPADISPETFDEYEGCVLYAIKMLGDLSEDEWKSKAVFVREQSADTPNEVHIVLRIRDLAISKAQNVMEALSSTNPSLSSRHDAGRDHLQQQMPAPERRGALPEAAALGSEVSQEDAVNQRLADVKNRILSCLRSELARGGRTTTGAKGQEAVPVRELVLRRSSSWDLTCLSRLYLW